MATAITDFQNLNELFERSVRLFGARPVLGTKSESGFDWITFDELAARVGHARSGLSTLGVKQGDRIALISDNCQEWVVLAFAAYSMGAVFVPMYRAQLPSEWEFILKDAEATIVIGADARVFEQLTDIASRVSSISHVLGLSLPAEDPHSYKHMMAEGAVTPVAAVEVSPNDLAGIIYTSGTTGDPKGVCLSHRNISSNVSGALRRFDFREGDTSLAFLPWAHVFGQTCELYSLIAAGAALALNDQVPKLVENLSIARPTVLVAVPRIFNRIYEGVNNQMAAKPKWVRALFSRSLQIAARRNAGEVVGLGERIILALGDRLIFSKVRQKFGGRLRFVVSGSAALSPIVAKFIDALGIDVFEGYGLTETSPAVSANYPGHRKIGTVGPAFPWTEIIVDTAGSDEPGQGEICIRGPGVMQGYYKRPEETAKVLSADGLFRTGDMGFVDEEGFLKLTGRIKEQYKLETGKYVVPSPLEEELKLSPFIANMMIHGANKPHNVALVVLQLDAVERWAKEHQVNAASLVDAPEVKKLILEELAKYSGELKSYERVKNVALIAEDFTAENGLLTPKMSLKRRNIAAKYADILESLYS
jgi:long-chain acyl-CoA synthetase